MSASGGTSGTANGISKGSDKLSYTKVFCDLSPRLTDAQAANESSRCYYCYDAPCIQACPTQIDIPSFIRKIGNQNIRGAALDILSSNILGGTCSRACPVETLCQEACVREKSEHKPVQIGALQRYATDLFFETKEQPFKRAKSSGKKVAVVGAGPAGLSCAHKLSTLGHEVTVYESKPKAGGLNEYGLAPYKMTDDFAQKEVDFVLGVGGIKIEHGKVLGKEITLESLKKSYSAVFLGLGLGAVNALGIEGENLPGVESAVKKIEEIRQAKKISDIEIADDVVIIGGGNTAVDIAIQMKRLGAENVTLVYRRGREEMGATHHEQELAQTNGVVLKTWAKPSKIMGGETGATSIEFERTELKAGKLVGTGQFYTLKAQQIFKAIGQALADSEASLKLEHGKLQIDDNFETSVPGIYAGGDCVGRGEDLTVTAVQHGKLAAIAIDRKLSSKGGKANG